MTHRSSITVRRSRWPDRPLRSNTVDVVGRDAFGVWAAVPAGSENGSSDGYEWAAAHDAVMLIPAAGDYTAYWSTYGTVYIDVAINTLRENGDVDVLDLDLDVTVDRDGNIGVVDVAEFRARSVESVYPEWLIERALRSLTAVVDAIVREQAPFDQSGWGYLARL